MVAQTIIPGAGLQCRYWMQVGDERSLWSLQTRICFVVQHTMATPPGVLSRVAASPCCIGKWHVIYGVPVPKWGTYLLIKIDKNRAELMGEAEVMTAMLAVDEHTRATPPEALTRVAASLSCIAKGSRSNDRHADNRRCCKRRRTE
ncbi:hypothetical protein TNCV_3493471 [Trichonephila clavipes]|nr:hypothetical protein TNCV_3493471 [Trichonephila clavipes]